MDLFFLTAGNLNNPIIVASKEAQISTFRSLEEANKEIGYGEKKTYEGHMSEAIHMITFQPKVVCISGDGEEDIFDKLTSLLKSGDGKFDVLTISNVAGRMSGIKVHDVPALQQYILNNVTVPT